MQGKSYTISDIARLANVSKTTVSRYLNGKYQYMSLETRETIARIIEESGYQPSKLAQNLKLRRSMLIGLSVADIVSPFAAAIIKGAGRLLLGTKYNLVITNSNNNDATQTNAIKSLLEQQVDGILLNSTSSESPEIVAAAKAGMPVVLIDRMIKGHQFDFVGIENEETLANAVAYLKDQGYHEFAFFTEACKDISPRVQRRESFVRLLEKAGVKHAENRVFEIDIDDEKTISNAVLKVAKKDTPCAIIGATGIVLLHTAAVIKNLGLDMPNDIGLCGFDDWSWSSGVSWAELVTPGITTFVASSRKIGERAVELLLDRMVNPDAPAQSIYVSTKFMERGSTKLKK